MTGVIEIGEFVAGSRQDEALSFGQLTQMDRHHFLLARIAVRAAFATRRIRVLLDVLAMFSSAFAAAMILSLSSDTGGVGAAASMAAKESRSFHPFESFGSFAGTGANSINN